MVVNHLQVSVCARNTLRRRQSQMMAEWKDGEGMLAAVMRAVAPEELEMDEKTDAESADNTKTRSRNHLMTKTEGAAPNSRPVRNKPAPSCAITIQD